MGEREAKELMKGFCRICSSCDGRACAGEVPGMGGTGSGSSFMANYDSLRNYKLNMQVFHNHKNIDTTVEIMGEKLQLPVLAAPVGGVDFNISKKVTEGEYLKSVVRGCNEAGTVACCGDGVPDDIFASNLEVINAKIGRIIPFIKPWEEKLLQEKLGKLQNTGAIKTVGIDVDSVGLSTIKTMGKEIYPRSIDNLMDILNNFQFNYILKGVMNPVDARKAVSAGADAIVVSNHGGRVLDHTPGVAEVLPSIVKEVGNDITILADGGIRSGIDVLKMLALGADAVMIGRPVTIAVFKDFDSGVANYLSGIKKELEKAMLLTGCGSIKEINEDILYNRYPMSSKKW